MFPSYHKALHTEAGGLLEQVEEINLSLHAVAIALIWQEMQTPEGEARIRQIVNTALEDYGTAITAQARLSQASGSGSTVTFQFKTPVPLRPAQVAEALVAPIKPFEITFKEPDPLEKLGKFLQELPPLRQRFNALGNGLGEKILEQVAQPAQPFALPDRHADQYSYEMAQKIIAQIPPTTQANMPYRYLVNPHSSGTTAAPFPGGIVPPPVDTQMDKAIEEITRPKGPALALLDNGQPRAAVTNGDVIIVRTELDSYHFLDAEDEDKMGVAGDRADIANVLEDIAHEYTNNDDEPYIIDLDAEEWEPFNDFFAPRG